MKQQTNHGAPKDKLLADGLFLDKLEDLSSQAAQRGIPRFTQFLDERQQALAEQHLHTRGATNGSFFGGHEHAQRKMLGFFPDSGTERFPILPITFTYPCFNPKDYPTHRDFLGALMGLGMKRELVGDILVEPGRAVAFLSDVAATAAQYSMDKIGRARMRMTEGAELPLPPAFTLQPIFGTVGSIRLDSVVALVLNLSREKAATLVKNGSVRVNFFEETRIALLLHEADILSIDGAGRFVVSKVGGESKKGRIHLTCAKYI